MSVCTTDASRVRGCAGYCIDPEDEECKTYPNLLFDHDIVDGRGMMCSVLTLDIGNSQGMGGVEFGKIYDTLPAGVPAPLRWPVLQRHGHADVSVCTTDASTKCVSALVYYVDLENEECRSPTRTCSSTATSSTAAA